ncbi:unnamed protein product [Symbiodinium sp. KB8]|nr:unnamed protein product [Symbiodinium sp. KB8]
MSARGIHGIDTDMDEHGKMLADAKSKIQEALAASEKTEEKDIAAFIKKKFDEDYGPTVSSPTCLVRGICSHAPCPSFLSVALHCRQRLQGSVHPREAHQPLRSSWKDQRAALQVLNLRVNLQCTL